MSKNLDSNTATKHFKKIKLALTDRANKVLTPLSFQGSKLTQWKLETKTLQYTFEFRQVFFECELAYGYNILDKYDELKETPTNDRVYTVVFDESWTIPIDPKDIPSIVDKMTVFLEELVKMVKRYKESKDLIDDYESGIIDLTYFGNYIGFQCYNLGEAYYYKKNYDKAIEYFMLVIDKYSKGRDKILREKKKAAGLWIEHINVVKNTRSHSKSKKNKDV